MKKIIVFLICLISFPMISNAAECNSQIYDLANNVNIAYSINSNGNTPIFTIYITNLTSEMLLLDVTKGKVYKNFSSSNNGVTIKTTTSGKYTLDIYSSKCGAVSIKTLAVDLPYYNKYYLDSRCKGYEKYPLCQRWSTYQANDKTFENDINNLINQNKKVEVKEEKIAKKSNTKWYNYISWAFIKFWWAFIIILILIMALFYVIRANQKKKEYNFKL